MVQPASASTSSRPTRLGRLLAPVRASLRFALDVALPPLCPACRGVLGEGGGLCGSCWSKLSFIAPPLCARLGTPFGYDPGPGVLSTEAIDDPPAFGRARAAVRYDDVAGALVHALKYGDRLDLAPTMGRWMAQAGRELIADADAIVPVPLHWRRLWARRFNQAAALGRVIAQASSLPVVDDALKRQRSTRQQVGLTRADRATNVQGAFEVPEGRRAAVDGRRLLLIDDVLTSGATVDSATRALLRAGAAQVDVLVFARVVDRMGAPI